MSAPITATPAVRRLPTAVALPAAIISAVVAGDLASYVISAVAHAAGVARSFSPLQPATFTVLIVVGVLVGGLGWQLVRTRAARPGRLLPRLVPAVLLLSFIPDLLIGITGGLHATWGGVAALMCMHVVVAAAAVTSYSLFLPAGSQAVADAAGTRTPVTMKSATR
jgi:Family of unknown function (DUF6069)